MPPYGDAEGVAQGTCKANPDAPSVSPISAELNAPITVYSVLVGTRTDDTRPPRFTWVGTNCGTTQTNPAVPHVFAWNHGTEDCPHDTEDHRDATILFTVSWTDGWKAECEYVGSDSGTGPACKVTFDR